MEQFSGIKSAQVMEYLSKRRTCMAKHMVEPAPSREEVKQILNVATRVPDHGQLSPWYFMVFEGDKRDAVDAKITELFLEKNTDYTPKQLDIETRRFKRAPMVIAVVSRIRNGKPMWEQILSSGAVCMNMILAANASGYGTQWLTEWFSYDEEFKAYLGLDARDHIAGFIHMGSVQDAPKDRPRPDVDALVTYWEEGAALNKGDKAEANKFGIPEIGFDLKGVKAEQ